MQQTQGDEIIDSYDSYPSDDQAVAALFAIWGITFAVGLVFIAINYLVTSIALAALFRKTGVAPWKAWVPVYNTYNWLLLGGQNGNWAWAQLVPYAGIVTSVFLYIGMYRTGKAFGKDGGFLVLGIFLPWVWLFILGFGRAEYRPELMRNAGLGLPLIGFGAQPAGAAFTQPPTPPYGSPVAYQPPNLLAPGYSTAAAPSPGSPQYPAPVVPPAAQPQYPAPAWPAPAAPASAQPASAPSTETPPAPTPSEPATSTESPEGPTP